jgi:hypothetical protein
MGTTQRLLEHAQRRLIPHEAYETDLAKDAVEGSTWLAKKTAAKKVWKNNAGAASRSHKAWPSA